MPIKKAQPDRQTDAEYYKGIWQDEIKAHEQTRLHFESALHDQCAQYEAVYPRMALAEAKATMYLKQLESRDAEVRFLRLQIEELAKQISNK